MSMMNSIPLSETISVNISAMFSITPKRLNGVCSSSILPASILERSRMSFTRLRSELADTLMIFRYSLNFSGRSISKARAVIPVMALRGVLIS